MTDRGAPYKNPARVPMTLQALDTAEHHEPAHVLTQDGTTNMAKTKIEKDGIYADEFGNHFYMAAGDVTGRNLTYVGPREKRARTMAPENKARTMAPETKSKKAD